MDGSPSRGKPFAFVFAFMRFGAPQVIEIRGSRSVQTQGQLGEDKEKDNWNELVAYYR